MTNAASVELAAALVVIDIVDAIHRDEWVYADSLLSELGDKNTADAALAVLHFVAAVIGAKTDREISLVLEDMRQMLVITLTPHG